MSGKLILVRHGETEGNVAKRLDTRLPGAPLTERGISQAQALSRRLAASAPAALVSSHALRARQTASYVETATGVELQVRDGLHEAQAGDLEDRTDQEAHETFKKVFHSWHIGDLAVRVPGGESGEDVLARYLPVVAQLRAEYLESGAGGDVIVVSHGAAIRLVGRHLAQVPGLFASNNHLDNTQTVELAPVAGGWECTRWGRFAPPFTNDVSPVPDDPMG